MAHHVESHVTEAFERLYRAEVARVFSYAAQRLGRADGEDVTADVFHTAAIVMAQRGPESVSPAWLTTAVKRRVIDRWRQRQRHRDKLPIVWASDPSSRDGSPTVADAATRHAVVTALSRLSARDRTLLILHHIDGIPISELASGSDMSIRAVESALVRARQRFRREYESEEVDRV